MEPLKLESVPKGALLLIDSAPIIYTLEDHPQFAPRFRPLFVAHEDGDLRFAVSTVTIVEVLTGPLQAGDEALARRYRALFETWRIAPLDADIAESAARLRAVYRLKLADAVQAATALALDAEALVTHDRDFSRLGSSLKILA